jgi:hypothetical protein
MKSKTTTIETAARNKRARILHKQLQTAAEVSPSKWAALMLWSETQGMVVAVPSWDEDAESEIRAPLNPKGWADNPYRHLCGSHGIPSGESIRVPRTPDVPLAILSAADATHILTTEVSDRLSWPRSVSSINAGILARMAELCAAVADKVSGRANPELAYLGETHRSIHPGQIFRELGDLDLKRGYRVVQVSASEITLQRGAEQPLSMSIPMSRSSYFGPLITVAGTTYYRMASPSDAQVSPSVGDDLREFDPRISDEEFYDTLELDVAAQCKTNPKFAALAGRALRALRKTNKARPVVLHTCKHCGEGFPARAIRSHQARCPKNPAICPRIQNEL